MRLIDADSLIRLVMDSTILGKGFKQAFVALVNGEPTAQPEHIADEWCTDCKEYDQGKHCCPRFNRVIREVINEAQPERKKGKWVYIGNEYLDIYKCNKCGYMSDHKTNFCSKCGADTRGEQDG